MPALRVHVVPVGGLEPRGCDSGSMSAGCLGPMLPPQLAGQLVEEDRDPREVPEVAQSVRVDRPPRCLGARFLPRPRHRGGSAPTGIVVAWTGSAHGHRAGRTPAIARWTTSALAVTVRGQAPADRCCSRCAWSRKAVSSHRCRLAARRRHGRRPSAGALRSVACRPGCAPRVRVGPSRGRGRPARPTTVAETASASPRGPSVRR